MSEYLKTNRTPFEIRTELLEIAQKYLEAQWEAQQEFARAAFMELLKQGVATQSDWSKYTPKYYDFNDIVAKAKELYGFVSSK